MLQCVYCRGRLFGYGLVGGMGKVLPVIVGSVMLLTSWSLFFVIFHCSSVQVGQKNINCTSTSHFWKNHQQVSSCCFD